MLDLESNHLQHNGERDTPDEKELVEDSFTDRQDENKVIDLPPICSPEESDVPSAGVRHQRRRKKPAWMRTNEFDVN